MMFSFKYPALFEPQPDGFTVVSFRDVPEALTEGIGEAEARKFALDALITAVDFYIEDGRPFPEPSAPQAGEVMVALPFSVGMKILLLNAMVRAQIRPAELARRMDIKPQQVTRILSLRHKTKIDTLQQAFEAIGYELLVEARP